MRAALDLDPGPAFADAACRRPGVQLAWFFPALREHPDPRAKELCEQCPEIAPCRQYALAHHGLAGLWGGLTESERAAIRKRARREA